MVVVAGETWLQGGAKRPGDFDTWPANLGRCWDYPIFSMEKNGRVIWNGSFLFVCLFVCLFSMVVVFPKHLFLLLTCFERCRFYPFIFPGKNRNLHLNMGDPGC